MARLPDVWLALACAGLLAACGNGGDSGNASHAGGGGSGGGKGGSGGSGATGTGATGSGGVAGSPVIPPGPGADERLFVPEIIADDGSQAIWNYRQKSTPFWFGKVDSRNNFTDCRAGYSQSLLMVRCAVFDQKIYDLETDDQLDQWDSLSLYLDLDGATDKKSVDDKSLRIDAGAHRQGNDVTVIYRGSSGAWQKASDPVGSDPAVTPDGINVRKAYRGEGADQSRGWAIEFFIGWKALGLSGPPLDPATARDMKLALVSYDRDDAAGTGPKGDPQYWPSATLSATDPSSWGRIELLAAHYLSWDESGSTQGAGQPAYSIAYQPAAYASGTEQSLSIRQGLDGATVENAAVGASGTLCSGDDAYNFGDGTNSWGGNLDRNYFAVQNEEDLSDWPCFAKIYLRFPLDKLTAGKVLVSAKLVLHHKEPTSGGTDGERSLIQAFPVAGTLSDGTTPWTEANINWNNAPMPFENAAGEWGDRTGNVETGWNALPTWEWDVSRALARSYAASDASASFVLYSADSEYNTGKQFVNGADFPDWGDPNQRPRLDVVLADPQ